MGKTWTSSIAWIWGKVLLLSFTGNVQFCWNIQFCSWNCCVCFVHRPAIGCALSSLCQSLRFILFCGYSDIFTGRAVWLVDKLRRCDVVSLGEWFATLWRCAFFFRIKLIVIFLGLFGPADIALWSLKTSGTTHPTIPPWQLQMSCGDKFMEWEVNIKFLMKIEKNSTVMQCCR